MIAYAWLIAFFQSMNIYYKVIIPFLIPFILAFVAFSTVYVFKKYDLSEFEFPSLLLIIMFTVACIVLPQIFIIVLLLYLVIMPFVKLALWLGSK